MATNGPKKSIMQILEEDAAEKIAKNPKSKSISEILQEDAAQHYQKPQHSQIKDPFYGGNRDIAPNRMKFDYNHQRLPSVPMYQSGPRGPPPMPPMAPFPPYHHPIPPDSGMFMPPLPPQQMPPPPQQLPPPPLPPQQMPQPPLHPHHPHMPPPPMLPPPYNPVPPHTVHYMQPPGPPLPITQSHHAFQPMPPPPAQNPPLVPPAPPPAPLLAPLPPDAAPPLPPLPPSEPPLPPPPKEPPPTSPIKKASVKQVTDSKAASVAMSQNHKKILSNPHSPDEYMTVSTSHVIPTIPLTSVKSTPRGSSTSVVNHNSSPQLPKSNSSTKTHSHSNQSHSSSYPNMAHSKSGINVGHPTHQPLGGPGLHYHHGGQSSSADLYDPEAMFSPTSSIDDSPTKDQAKNEDSLIDKYVRDFSSKSSGKAPTLESQNSPDKKVSLAPDTKKESPVRIDLDSRLKMMFGGGTKPSSKTTERVPVKMPTPMAERGVNKIESVPAIQTASDDERPLSPPPSPFLSKKIYLYWHAETIRVRKASKHSATDFVTAGSSKTPYSTNSKTRSHESARGPDVRANGQQGNMPPPPPPANFLPTVPPPSYKNLSQDDMQGRNLKADSSLKNSTTVQFHPYKRTVEKLDDSSKSIIKSSDIVSNVNNNSISKNRQSLHSNNSKLDSDSELELTCKKPIDYASKSENKVSVNVSEPKKVPAVSDSFLKAKTVGLVMSKILAELRQTIRQELVKKLLEDNIMDTTES